MKGIYITTDSSVEVKDFPQPTLTSMQEAVGGDIEIVRPIGLDAPLLMVVDGEGLLKEYDMNFIGSVLYGTLLHGNPIVGNIVILKEGFVDGEPDIVGLDETDIETVITQLKNLGLVKEIKK